MVTQRALGLHVRGLVGAGLPGAARALLRGAGLGGLAGADGLDPVELDGDAFQRGVAHGLLPLGFVGVVADHPPSVGGAVEADLLDAEVVADLGVAALPGQCLFDQGCPGPHPFPGDEVTAGAAQVVQVRGGGEPPVHDGDDPAQAPVPHAVLDLGQYGLVVGVAGPAPTPHRDPFLGHGQPDHDLGQVGAVVLGMPVSAERTVAFLLGVAFEVGGGGVEQQHVDLQVQQVGDGEEHRLLHPGLGVCLHQQVHRPVGLVLIHHLQPGDRDVMADPLRGGQLGDRIDRPVRDQREQHPFHVGAEPPGAQHLPQRDVDTELTPQRIEEVGGPHRPGLGHLQAVADQHRRVRGHRGRGGLAEVPVDRDHQPGQAVTVQAVLTAQVEQHLSLGHALDAAVVRELDVADHAAVLVPPLSSPQVHAHHSTVPGQKDQARHDKSCAHAFRGLPKAHNALTWANAGQEGLMCPSTAERGLDTPDISTSSQGAIDFWADAGNRVQAIVAATLCGVSVLLLMAFVVGLAQLLDQGGAAQAADGVRIAGAVTATSLLVGGAILRPLRWPCL